ncbi:hypothetical protein ACFV2N_43635 [Streptomyces sp. NPDC059680]|uniref:hypothetical protein n=1 Tax=Streptomyces sp. NPDC059680 TaxID=3346904 RepID=UPI0036B6BA4A
MRETTYLLQVGVGAGDACLQGRLVGAAAHDHGVEVPVRGVGQAERPAEVHRHGLGILGEDRLPDFPFEGEEVVTAVRAGDVAVEAGGDVVGELAHPVSLLCNDAG